MGGRLRVLESYCEALKILKQASLIRMRNGQVSHHVRHNYQLQTKDKLPLPVICVSNKDYRTRMDRHRIRDMPPAMDVIGIPAIRLCALSLPSKDRFERVLKCYSFELPNALAHIRGWCHRSGLERYFDLRKLVEHELDVCTSFLVMRKTNGDLGNRSQSG